MTATTSRSGMKPVREPVQSRPVDTQLRARFHREVVPLRNLLYRHAFRTTRNHADAEGLVLETMMKAEVSMSSAKVMTGYAVSPSTPPLVSAPPCLWLSKPSVAVTSRAPSTVFRRTLTTGHPSHTMQVGQTARPRRTKGHSCQTPTSKHSSGRSRTPQGPPQARWKLPANARGNNSKLMSQPHATGSPQRRIA